MCAEVIGESDELYAALGLYGFKVAVLKDDKPMLIIIVLYGGKDKHAYWAELWTDESMFAKRAFIHILRLFDVMHKGWTVIFSSNFAQKYFGSRSKKYDKKFYQYTGCL